MLFRSPFYGAVVACVDDPHVRTILPRLTRRVITYGFSSDAEVGGIEPSTDGQTARCRVAGGELVVAVPGLHNLQNALAAVAVGRELDVPLAKVATALAEFHGADRRFQIKGRVSGVTVVDDYGHHPTEIAAVLRAARAGQPARIIVAFQPHRYTRTRDLLADFGRVLSEADVTLLTDIYAAGETPLPGVSSAAVAEAVRTHGRGTVELVPLADIAARVAAIARPGDLVLTLGAGSIGQTGDAVVEIGRAHV